MLISKTEGRIVGLDYGSDILNLRIGGFIDSCNGSEITQNFILNQNVPKVFKPEDYMWKRVKVTVELIDK